MNRATALLSKALAVRATLRTCTKKSASLFKTAAGSTSSKHCSHKNANPMQSRGLASFRPKNIANPLEAMQEEQELREERMRETDIELSDKDDPKPEAVMHAPNGAFLHSLIFVRIINYIRNCIAYHFLTKAPRSLLCISLFLAKYLQNSDHHITSYCNVQWTLFLPK